MGTLNAKYSREERRIAWQIVDTGTKILHYKRQVRKWQQRKEELIKELGGKYDKN